MEETLGPRIQNIESGGKLTGERRVGVKKQTAGAAIFDISRVTLINSVVL